MNFIKNEQKENVELKDGSTKECDMIVCPLRDLLSRLGDKWTVLILITLAKREKHQARFSEIKKEIPDISQRMLTTTLRSLERDGLLSRTVYPEVPPRVEYQLTELGTSILVPMEKLVDWLEINWDEIKKARKEFDVKNGEH